MCRELCICFAEDSWTAKYVNAVSLYWQKQEFVWYGLNISRQNMANWTIQCADRYLAIL